MANIVETQWVPSIQVQADALSCPLQVCRLSQEPSCNNHSFIQYALRFHPWPAVLRAGDTRVNVGWREKLSDLVNNLLPWLKHHPVLPGLHTCIWLWKSWSFLIYAIQIFLFYSYIKIFYATYVDKTGIKAGEAKRILISF